MFFMNKEDADSALEAVVLMNSARLNQQRYYGPSAQDLRDEQPIYQERSENIRLAVQLNQAGAKTNIERKKLRRFYCTQHHLIGCARAARTAVESLIAALPEKHDQMWTYAHQIMRKSYDTEIDRFLNQKILTYDPRNEGAVWAMPTRQWYASLKSRTGKGPASELDATRASELESMQNQAEDYLHELANRAYEPSERGQRHKRLDVARAESIRISAEILKMQGLYEEARVKQVHAAYRCYDLHACVLAWNAALKPFYQDAADAKRTIYGMMRRTYDAYIDDALSRKQVLDDPRKDEALWSDFQKDWYFNPAR